MQPRRRAVHQVTTKSAGKEPRDQGYNERDEHQLSILSRPAAEVLKTKDLYDRELAGEDGLAIEMPLSARRAGAGDEVAAAAVGGGAAKGGFAGTVGNTLDIWDTAAGMFDAVVQEEGDEGGGGECPS